jgi:DNA-binding MarR family transcriptional regulator
MQPNDKLANVIRFVRKDLNAEMPIQQLAILIEIQKNEGVTMYELGRELGITPGSMSRNISALSLYIKKGEKKGLDLVTTRPDLNQRRRLACFLTDKGRNIMAEILDSMH